MKTETEREMETEKEMENEKKKENKKKNWSKICGERNENKKTVHISF